MKLYETDAPSLRQKVIPSHMASPSFPALSTPSMGLVALLDWEGGTIPVSSLCAQHSGHGGTWHMLSNLMTGINTGTNK